MTVAAAAPRLSRRISEYAFLTFCWVATAVAIVALAAILWSLLSQGIGGFLKPDGGGLDLDIFTKSTPAPGSVGGLMNAILGSIMMCVVAMIGAVFIGVLAGTWLSEFARDSHYGKVIRFLNDVLLSAPSILVGLFIYEVLVHRGIGHFSGLAGAVALALIAAPVITRTTEDVLRLQQVALREASVALGARRHADGSAPGLRPHQRRDRAAALHGAEQPVLQPRPDPAHGQPAGGDLQFRPFRLR
jgi:phosphate transport system permease protein